MTGEHRWRNAERNEIELADALTKRDFKLRKIMADFCMNPEVCLIHELSKSDKANETSETDT